MLNVRRAFLPLVIVPLILCIILTIAVYYVAHEQILESGQMAAEKFAYQANSVLSELKIVSDSLMSNEQFINFAARDKISLEEVSSLNRIIHNQMSHSSYVQETLLISAKHGNIYNDSAYFDIESLPSILRSIDVITDDTAPYAEDMLEEGWHLPENSFSSPYYIAKIHDASEEVSATLIVILAKGYLYRTLFSTNSAFCCIYNEDFLLSSAFRTNPDIDYTSASGIAKAVGEPVEVFVVRSGNYNYLAALTKSSFYRPLYMILLAFGIYFLLVLLFSIVHVIRVNQTEKAFFKDLVSELPTPITQDAGIQEIFGSIQNALKNYQEERSSFYEQKKYQNLERLSQGHIGRALDENLINSMGIDDNAVCYRMLRFHMDESGILDPTLRSDLISIILEQAINGFSKERFNAVCFPDKGDFICAVLNIYDSDLTYEDLFEIVMKHVHRMLERDYGIIFSCAVSAAVTAPADLNLAGAETLDLMHFVHAIDSNAKFVSSEQLEGSPSFLIRGEFLKQLQTLAGTLLIHRYDLIPTMVDKILDENVTPLRKNYGYAEERLRCVATILHSAPLPASLSEEDVNRIHARLKDAGSVSELSEAARSCFSDLEYHPDEDSPASKAIAYISEHVSDTSLSVPDIAEHAGVSVQHLSRLFKEQTGTTMVEYINQYRMNLVQELLAGTSMTIAEIAEQTGYTNTVTLTRNFKRYVGCTPSEYRQRVSNA